MSEQLRFGHKCLYRTSGSRIPVAPLDCVETNRVLLFVTLFSGYCRRYLPALFVSACASTMTTPIPAQAQDIEIARGLVINELLATPNAGVPEFIEILNVGPEAVDLSGLLIEDARRKPGKITSSDSVWIDPGEFVVLTSDLSALELEFGSFRGWEVRPWPSLNNSGDDIRITLDGVQEDSVKYVASWLESGKSLERISPFAPASFRGNWASSSSDQGATPGLENSLR